VQWLVTEPPTLIEDRRKLLARGIHVDYLGFALVVLGFGALQIMLDRYEQDDGFSSDFIFSLGMTALVCLSALVVWEALHKQPIVNLRLLRIRPSRLPA